MATTIIAVAAVASVAVSAISLSMQGDGPNMGAAPAPANYYQYDENGNLTSSSVWDADRHAFINRENPEPQPTSPEKYFGDSNFGAGTEPSEPDEATKRNTPNIVEQYNTEHAQWLDKRNQGMEKYDNYMKDWKASSGEWGRWNQAKIEREREKQLRTEIRTKMLENLNRTPEDRVAAYEQYAKTFSESMQKGVNEQYNLAKQSQEEKMSATGMMGSRAYADTMGQMEKEKLKADVNIAQQGQLAKNELANVDRNYWLNVLNSIDSGARADAVVGMQKSQAANQAALGGTAAQMGQYMANSQNQWNKWNADMARQQGMINTINNGASGLMYLYGYGGRGGGSYNYGNVSALNTTLPADGLSFYNY